MSDYYVEKNNESTLELFQKRFIYRANVVQSSELKNIVDFNFGEKYFYGRVNRVFIPMQRNPGGVALKNFEGASPTGAPLTAFSFVVDAFTALAQQFRKCALTGKISTTDLHLSNLVVQKGYEDPADRYDKYLQIAMSTITSQIIVNQTVLRNFDDFIKEVMVILKGLATQFPFTMPAYVKSKYCPIACSGLAVEIATLSADNDNAKIEEFVNSPNWDFYVNACNTYGFMIDEFMPWRLVADIGSAPMIEFARQYSLTSTNTILARAYRHTHEYYYAKFKYYLLNLYNQTKAPNYVVTEECNGVTLTDLVTPEEYTIQQLNQKYNQTYFLRLYCTIRFYEERSVFDEGSQYRLIDDTLEIYETHGLKRALYNFERIINKPFDYRGSLSYISRHIEAVRDSEDP